jgi:hypothetical protein
MMNGHSSSDEPSNNDNSNKNLNPRSCILQVGCSAGRLCGVANTHMNPHKTETMASMNGDVVVLAMSELLHDLWLTSQSLNMNLIVAVRNKLALNNIKYPVEHCKVRRNGSIQTLNSLFCLKKSSSSNQTSTCLLLFLLLLTAGQNWKVHAVQPHYRNYQNESKDNK